MTGCFLLPPIRSRSDIWPEALSGKQRLKADIRLAFPPVPEGSEGERLRRALEQCGGNRTRTAKLLGMDSSTLWRKLQKYGI